MIYLFLIAIIILLASLLTRVSYKIRKIKKRQNIELENSYSACNEICINSFVDSYKADSKPVVVYVFDYLFTAGGVETRTAEYISHLTDLGYRVIVLSSKNDHQELKLYDNCYINFRGGNAQECMEKLLKKISVKYLEFHFKSEEILHNLDLEPLRSKTKIGCSIHNVVNAEYLSHHHFDYITIVSELLKKKYIKELPSAVVLPNAVNLASSVYQYPKTKEHKAIIISRLCKEKLPTIEAFIIFCQNNKIIPHIAGPVSGRKDIRKTLLKKYNLKESNFLGLVDISILSNKLGEYLFVGGVGQVILQSGILGYPIFLASHLGIKDSLFVRPENISFFSGNNFTIKSKNATHPSSANKQKDIQEIFAGNVGAYNLNSVISSEFKFDNVFEKYKALLKSCD